MLVDGLNLLEGSTIKNASIAVGTSFPTSPDAGELFFRSDLSALHVYTGSTWLILDGTATLLQGHPGSYYVDLTNATNTLDVTHGGTSVTSYAALRTALGLDIGTNVQAYDADLSSIAALAGTSGLLRKTAANTWALDSTSYLSTSGGTIVGDLTLTGNIIPSANNTYSLGSATMTWKDVWVGPGSLYVNGKEVLSDVSNTMVFTTDLNQNLRVQTSGTGTLELQADATGTIAVKGTMTITSGKKILDSAGVQVEFGDNIEMGTNKITGLGTPTLGTDAATKSYVDAISVNDSTIVRTSGDQTIGGTKTFSGNVTIGGTLNSAGNTVLFADNIIELNSDFTAGTPTEDAGFQVRRGDLGIAKFYWDETNDRFTMQDGAGANLSLYTTGTITGGSFVGPVSGNASTATTLQTARTIGASGDATAPGQSFNGSANITIPLTLATVNSNVGSFGAADSVSTFTVNGKGLLTAAGSTSIQIAESQITDGSLLARNAGNETITGSWTFNNVVIGADPTLATHLTTKSYVDNAVLGLTWKAPCVAATTANITLSGTQTIDGIAVTAGQRVLVKNQSTGSQNGVYVVSAGAWTRATDFDQTAPIDEVNSAAVFVKGGTSQSDTGWTQTAAVTTVGTDAMTFVQFSAAGAYSAGTGLTLTGNVFSITSPSMTVGSTNIALGGTATTIAGLTSVTSTSFTGNLTGNVTGSVTGGTISGTTITASSDITAGSASKIVSGTGGFQNATYLTATRNRIWSFGNADGFGLSYFQGTSGYTGTDSIGFHFGTATSAASSVNITGSGIVIGTSTVLHSTNFNSYAPTLTGTGASGTWSINVTGNAGTATSATYSRAQGVWDGTSFQAPNHAIGTSGSRSTDLAPNTYNWALTNEFKNSGTYGFTGNYTGLLTFSPWLGTTASTGDPAYQLAFTPAAANSTAAPSLRLRAGIDTTWGAWNTIVHSGNYTSFSPTLTGGNASGTWNINVSGNANNITQYTVNQNLGTGNAVSFDQVYATNNGNGTNFKIGDDAWIGDVNVSNAFRVMGQQSNANGYIIFGNADTTALGRAGSGALTYGGNAVLHAGNYSSYSPSLTGGGASGTWGINISGNAGTATTATNLSGGSISATSASFSGQINTKTPVAVTAITSATYNSAPIEIPNLAIPNSYPQFVPFVHGSSVISGVGYVQHVTIGNIRTATNSWSGGAFIGLGGNDSYPTEYYTLGFGGTITHSSGTSVLNSSNYTSYALATGGTAVKASTLAQGGGNGTAMTFNWSGQGGQPTWLWGSNDGSNIYVYNPSNFSVNYAASAGSATTAGSCSGNSATVTHNGSRTDGTAYPVGWFSGSNSPAYSCANVTITSSTGTLSASALYSSGDITAFSDARVKTNIVEIPNALEKVEAIRGVTYTRTDEGFEGVRQAGVIAQEVEAVLPEVVKTNEDGMKSVAYGNLTALLIEAVKELSAQNKALLARIEHLEAHQWN